MPDPQLFAGRYRIDATLGEGGFKTVYRAHDRMLRRNVALAVFRLDRTQTSARTEVIHEARALARLGDNPRIVTVFDVGEADGIPYLVTRLMTGGDLLALLERSPNRRLPSAQAVGIACDVLEALHTAHAEGVVHRDVTPNNIWLDQTRRAVLGDFGIAAGGAAGGSTRLSDAAGKLPYMAPEVMQGQRATPRSDLYSLGCTLYETLTGRPPFVGDPAAIIAQHLTTAPPPVPRFVPDAPVGLDRAVAGLLAKDPSQRPESAGAAATKLRQALAPPPKRSSPRPTLVDTQAPTRPRGQRATERVPPPVAAAPPQPRRTPAGVWWGAAAAGLIVVLLIAAMLLASREAENGSGGRQSASPPQITDLKVYNNVFDQQEQDFELGKSIAACFTITPQGDSSPLVVAVMEGNNTPRDQSDPAILGRSEAIRVEAASSCYPVPLASLPRSAGRFAGTVWILQGDRRLEFSSFQATIPGDDRARAEPTPTLPAAPPSPTPPPTPSPTPRPAWMVVQGLPPELWECANVRPAPAQDPALNCLPNGTVVQITGEPQALNGRLWWPVNYGGWMAQDYLVALAGAPSTTPAPVRSPQEVVRLFYENLGQQRWPAAYQLRGTNSQRARPYGEWVRNFDTTEAVVIESIGPGATPDTVTAQYVVTDRANSGRGRLVRRFEATWRLVSEGSQWRLDAAQPREIPSATSTPSPMPPPPSPSPVPSPTITPPTPTPATSASGTCVQIVSWRINPGTSFDEVVGEVANTCAVSVCLTLQSVAYRDAMGRIAAVSEASSGPGRVLLGVGDVRPFRFTVRAPTIRTAMADVVYVERLGSGPGAQLFC